MLFHHTHWIRNSLGPKCSLDTYYLIPLKSSWLKYTTPWNHTDWTIPLPCNHTDRAVPFNFRNELSATEIKELAFSQVNKIKRFECAWRRQILLTWNRPTDQMCMHNTGKINSTKFRDVTTYPNKNWSQ